MALMLSGYLAHVCTERWAWSMLYNLMLCLPSQILYSYGSGSDSPNNNNNNNSNRFKFSDHSCQLRNSSLMASYCLRILLISNNPTLILQPAYGVLC